MVLDGATDCVGGEFTLVIANSVGASLSSTSGVVTQYQTLITFPPVDSKQVGQVTLIIYGPGSSGGGGGGGQTTPGDPTGVTANINGSDLGVSWSAPSNTGGGLTGYHVEFMSDISGGWQTLGGDCPARATNPLPTTCNSPGQYPGSGMNVFVRVNAYNNAGTSNWVIDGPYN